jgi:hypothetical protein
VALLTRLLISQLGVELSRTEVGLLNTLSGGPRRITESSHSPPRPRRWRSS